MPNEKKHPSGAHKAAFLSPGGRKAASLRPLVLLLLAAFAVRAALCLVTEGYSTDIACFTAWAQRMAQLGPGEFYAPDYFADYPPGYMLVLWLVGELAALFQLDLNGKAILLLLGMVPILCDLGTTALVYHIGCRFLDHRRAIRLAAMAAFCPPLLYDTGVWKQVDGVFTLCILASFWLLCRKKYLPSAVLFGLALAVKPQALLFGPVLAVCFAAPLLQAKSGREVLRILGRALAGAAAALAVVMLCALPFWGDQPAGWLLEKYTGTVSSYPYASINGFNLLTLLGGNWTPQTEGVLGTPLTWQALGTAGILLATGALLYLAWQGMKHRRFDPLLLAGFYGAAVFCLSHRMHERYLIPALLLILAAAARSGDRRLLASFGLLSFSTLLNLAMVLTSNGTEDQFLTSDTAVVMIAIVSAINLAGTVLLTVAAFRLCRGGAVHDYLPRGEKLTALPAAQPRWSRKEGIFLAVTTLLVGVVSLWNLGDMTAPQTPLDVIGADYETQVTVEGQADSLWIYPSVNWNGRLLVTDETGSTVADQALDHSNVFHWIKLDIPASGSYTIQLTDGRILELAFKDGQNQLLPVNGDASGLFDEQDLVPETISYKNSMYFDEIYHGRTAYEHLHGMPVYETTHPPLGKVFIMLGVAVFGMTGFGWRVSGALFGVAMVPVLYRLVRRLTRSPQLAAFAALLAGFDLMRYSQSRIATIDVYGTFFILLGAYFMVWYAQSVLEKGVNKSILPMALAGLAFGLGAASKWTGIYAGAGLAILYFGVLWARWKQKQPGFAKEFRTAILGGVAFFVLVPLAVYLASYLPYCWREGGFSLSEWWQCQLTMFNYHSQLKSTHPFESRWYAWPFAVRPVWYYSGSGLPEGMRGTISGMGNPIVWWAALAAMAALVWRQISGRSTRAQGGVLVLYLTQLLPWVLVTRCTFQYHYFPSLWFAVTALALMLGQLAKKDQKLARGIGIGLVAAAAVVFVWFYPVVTGIPVSTAWVKSTQWLNSWYY